MHFNEGLSRTAVVGSRKQAPLVPLISDSFPGLQWPSIMGQSACYTEKISLTLLAMYCASLWDYTIASSLTLGFGFLQQVLPSCIDIKAPTSAILLGFC
ncbi:hypothetical protein Pelo_5754 [Pelomyxa schiedti]|nr:hypothetical protein Pelo_5754 [Pelomyxa schiedti]